VKNALDAMQSFYAFEEEKINRKVAEIKLKLRIPEAHKK
jgi:hypothetical protein